MFNILNFNFIIFKSIFNINLVIINIMYFTFNYHFIMLLTTLISRYHVILVNHINLKLNTIILKFILIFIYLFIMEVILICFNINVEKFIKLS